MDSTTSSSRNPVVERKDLLDHGSHLFKAEASHDESNETAYPPQDESVLKSMEKSSPRSTRDCATQTRSPLASESSSYSFRTITFTPEQDTSKNATEIESLVPDSSPPKPSNLDSSPTESSPTNVTSQRMPKNLSFPKHCITHTPTLEELKSRSFSDFVRQVVLPEAHPYDLSKDEEQIDFSLEIMELTEGIAKVSLPDGFWREETFQGDRTGRGPAWRKGTRLGDFEISSPIKQNINGLAGVYEYTFTVEKPLSVAEFREKADAYRERQVGKGIVETYTETDLLQLEAKFWKRLGPTMEPAMYGADQEGTFFGDDDASGWSLAELDSCLHVLPRVPGVTSPYIYAGMWGSVFAAHTEDVNLLSINYLHAGAPKIWYAIAPGPDSKRFEALAQHEYSVQFRDCKEFLRHKRCLISPKVLQRSGIRYQTAVQMPGEAIITFPGGYHFGFNAGFNIAEATNFGVPEWIPYARKANICMCRPDSVRIDIDKLVSKLEIYNNFRKRNKTISWLEWYRRREDEKTRRLKREQKFVEQVKKFASKKKSEQQRKNEFWVEVMQPFQTKSAATVVPCATHYESEAESTEEAPEIVEATVLVENDIPGKRQRKPKRHFDEVQAEIEKKEKALYSKKKTKKKELVQPPELWHLAKPVGKQKLVEGDSILCLVPGMEFAGKRRRQVLDVDDEEEHCFKAKVVEIDDGHVLCTFDGLSRSEDQWLPLDGTKVFLDGGQWTEKHQEEGIPTRHFWQEFDSRYIEK